MVDTFLFLTLARTGDSLQGMKRGILELADVDRGEQGRRARTRTHRTRAARELAGALRMLRGPEDSWRPPVVTCSGLHNHDVDTVWKQVLAHRAWLDAHGELTAKRRRQLVDWTRAMVRDRLLASLDVPAVRQVTQAAEAAVLEGTSTPDQAASAILAALADEQV